MSIEESAPALEGSAFQTALAGVLDDDAGVGAQIGADVGVHALGIGDRGRDPVLDQAPRERAALDQELDIERALQHAVQGPDDKLVL